MLTIIAAVMLAQDPGPMREVEELRREIEVLRTVNALELTRDQLSSLVKLADESRRRIDGLAEDSKAGREALAAALRELRDALAKGEKPDPEAEQKVGELQRAVGEGMRGVMEAHEKLSGDVRKVLTEKQWKAVQSLTRPDPARPLREMFRHMVERLREEPELDPGEPFRHHLMRMSRPLGLSEKDVDAEVERIVKIVDEAAEAEPSKLDEFARRVFEEGKLGEAAKKMTPPEEEGTRRIAQTFLDPRIVSALKARLEHMK